MLGRLYEDQICSVARTPVTHDAEVMAGRAATVGGDPVPAA